MKRVISTESRVFSLFRRGGSAARIRALEEQNRVQAATIDQHVATIKQINEKLHALSTRAEAEAERDYQLVMAQQNLMAELKDLDAGFAPVFESCRRFTMTSIERLYALYKAVEYVARARIAGDLVETGVWRGGSMMLVAKTLLSLEDAGRRLYLYDTYEGHPKPDAERDVDLWGNVAHSEWIKHRITDSTSDWAKVSIEEVRRNMDATSYPAGQVHLVKGMVEQTAPATGPSQIALLRLDTDWYESTRVALQTFYPRLSVGGVLIVDDYGHYRGQRQAVDEFFAADPKPPLLSRIDYSCRVAIKC